MPHSNTCSGESLHTVGDSTSEHLTVMDLCRIVMGSVLFRAYNGMIKCYKAAAGDCKALKDKIQEQIDQAAKMLDGKCSSK